jgi:BirA family biotin operon repressor/biotin-[acetyl-CoA-carboxylase] ligase
MNDPVVHALETAGSTNDEAIRLALLGAPEGTVVTADFQTAGRGRDGRGWVSPRGQNLLLSIVVRPRLKPSGAPVLTLLAAHAVQDTLASFGIPSAVKKPNDVLVEGKKIAGILTESRSKGDALEWCVVGVGLNVNAGKEDLPEEAVSLRMLGHEKSVSEARDLFLKNFRERYESQAGS